MQEIPTKAKLKVCQEDDCKPGYLTTEFLSTVINQVIGVLCILIAVFGLDPENSNSQLLIVSGLALMGVQGVGYGISRAIVKAASRRYPQPILSENTKTN